MTEAEQLIADQADLEAFARLPPAERQVTDPLRGVLAETAVTGVIRYPWPLLQPLLAHIMKEQLAKYEAEEHVEIGPARPILDSDGGSVQQLGERFSRMLSGFDSHPWTLQRLCEVVLEPQKQYKRLHKLALAIEKLLLVTGELGLSEQPGPLPPLSHLARVNEAPPPSAAAAAAAAGSNAASRQGDSDGSGLVAAALSIRQQPQQAGAEGNPPAAAAAAADPMQVDTPATVAAAAAAGAAAAENGGPDVAMETEPPAAVGAAPEAAAAAATAAAGDTEMAATEEQAPTVTEHAHVNSVGTTPAEAGGGGPAGAS